MAYRKGGICVQKKVMLINERRDVVCFSSCIPGLFSTYHGTCVRALQGFYPHEGSVGFQSYSGNGKNLS